MPARYEYLLTGDHDAGTKVVMDALEESGYTLEAADPGSIRISRGDVRKTALLNTFAGQDFHVTFLLAFGRHPDGHLAARIGRDHAGGSMKGGWLGASKTGRTFDATVADVRSATERAGILHAHGEPAA